MIKVSINITLVVLMVFISCKENNKKENIVEMAGNDRDSHGCIGSAGYQWSELKQKCIRVFELPLKLTNDSNTQIAGVVFTDDKMKAEVFTGNGVFFLNKKTDTSYLSEAEPNHKFLDKKNGKWEFGDSKEKTVEYKEK
jgi:hypothetical protein